MITEEQKREINELNKKSNALRNESKYFVGIFIASTILGCVIAFFGFDSRNMFTLSFGCGLISYGLFIHPLRIICQSLAGLFRLRILEFKINNNVEDEFDVKPQEEEESKFQKWLES